MAQKFDNFYFLYSTLNFSNCHAIRLRDGWIIFIPAGRRFNLTQKKVLALFVRCFKPCGGSGAAAKCFLCVPFPPTAAPATPPRSCRAHRTHKGYVEKNWVPYAFQKSIVKRYSKGTTVCPPTTWPAREQFVRGWPCCWSHVKISISPRLIVFQIISKDSFVKCHYCNTIYL